MVEFCLSNMCWMLPRVLGPITRVRVVRDAQLPERVTGTRPKPTLGCNIQKAGVPFRLGVQLFYAKLTQMA